MVRRQGDNGGWDHATLSAVWAKGHRVKGQDSDQWRKDDCAAWIRWEQYGNRNSKRGWEVHHVVPQADGGSDELENLVPLQWENNASTGDGPLKCVVTDDDD